MICYVLPPLKNYYRNDCSQFQAPSGFLQQLLNDYGDDRNVVDTSLNVIDILPNYDEDAFNADEIARNDAQSEMQYVDEGQSVRTDLPHPNPSSPEHIAHNYDGRIVRKRDMDSLVNQSCLHTDLINIALSVIETHKYDGKTQKSKRPATQTSTSNAVENESVDTVKVLRASAAFTPGRSFGAYKDVHFGTVLYNAGLHYVAFENRPKRYKMQKILMDSLGIPTEHLRRQIVKLCGERRKDTKVHRIQVQRQPDSTTCGYFALLFCAAVKLGLNPAQCYFDTADNKLAKWVLELLQTNAIPPLPLLRKGVKVNVAPDAPEVCTFPRKEVWVWLESNVLIDQS